MGKKLRVIEICAGAGGQALGLDLAGFEHALAVELDSTAAETLKTNRPGWKVAVGDVADRSVWNPADYAPTQNRPAIDLFAGGVPCPPFSIAGKQKGAADERDLFAWAVEQVEVLQPRAVMLENVRGLSMPRFAGYRQHVLDKFRDLGYNAEWRLLNSSDFGVPQLRPRFVLIALKPEEHLYFHWPEPLKLTRTVGQVLLPLMKANGWKGAEKWAAGANAIAPTVVGGSKKHGGADLGPTRAKAAWANLGVDGRGVANAAPGPDEEFTIGPKLTCEMVARIQGWDDEDFSWKFEGRKTSIYRQIGNAFPPPVARALGTSIARALQHKGSARTNEDFMDEADPIYCTLRDSEKYLNAAQIIKKSGVTIDAPELDRKISILNQDFEILKESRPTGIHYKLGNFRAFTGQESHARHEFFREHVSKVS